MRKIQTLGSLDKKTLENYFLQRNTQNLSPFHWQSSEITESINSGKHQSLALIEENKLLAFVLFSESTDVCEILYLETHPQYLRQGWMGILWSEFIKEKHNKEIWLDVHEKNRAAHDFYQSCGFKIVGDRPNYYADHGRAILMSLPAQIK